VINDSLPTGHRGRPRLVGFGLRLLGATFGRLGVSAREWACVIPVFLLAAADRFVNLPARGTWDMDQGYELGAIWNAVLTRQLPTFGSPAYTIGPTFHHGALFYDLMIPISWASHGNPTAIVTEIALFGLMVVPLVWWTARSMGGTAAGLAAALLAAVSPSLIENSTFIWNPVLVEPGVAIACFGAWQAWHTRQPRWWIVAAAGTALAAQSHLTGLALIFPMAIFFAIAVWRSPAGERRRLFAWGLGGVALFVLTWMPWIVSELTHGFAETQAILAFKQDDPPGADPLIRVLITSIRILAWPATRWPMSGLTSGFPAALTVSGGILAGLIWRTTGVLTVSPAASSRRARSVARRAVAATPIVTATPTVDRQKAERAGILFVGGSLLLLTLIFGLGLKEVSQFATNINEEQYHSVADVFVILATGLVLGGIWRARPIPGRQWSGPALASIALVGLVAVGVYNWPPIAARDGGWASAQTASLRLESDVPSRELALVAVPSFTPSDTYGYPLLLDGIKFVAPDKASTVVIVCYTLWATGSCDGDAETAWLGTNLPGESPVLIDRWDPAPDRVLSVYRRAP
jgi:4-amino-4-deoxy-L-arabinose transferase-like glycosyltransferase